MNLKESKAPKSSLPAKAGNKSSLQRGYIPTATSKINGLNGGMTYVAKHFR